MQRNSTVSNIMLYYTMKNLDYNYEPSYWTHIPTDQLVQNIIQNYLINEDITTRNLQVLIIRLIFENTNLHYMIQSEDCDTSQLAIQMLFNNYLDLYNILDTTKHYEYTLHDYPKFITYYINIIYEKYSYRY